MPKQYLMPQETDLLVRLENSSDFSSQFDAIEIARLLGLGASSQLAGQLAEAKSEAPHRDNGGRS